MSNSLRYHYNDFTMRGYGQLLQLAKKQYVFRLFDHVDLSEKFILWRHDVDCSVNAALRLAKLEAQEGLQSTYFFHLHSEFYNLFEKKMTDMAREISQLGHAIGLHFDAGYHDLKSRADLQTALSFEKQILETVLNCEIRAFSFHNPGNLEDLDKDECLAGMINVYSSFFQKNVSYVSDSNGFWRYRNLKDVLASGDERCLQVLTHPEWWSKKVLSPKQRIWRCIDGRADATKVFYLKVLAESGREVVDGD